MLAQLKAQRRFVAELMGLVATIMGGIGMCLDQGSMVLLAIVFAIVFAILATGRQ